jgi:hypothetical protein
MLYWFYRNDQTKTAQDMHSEPLSFYFQRELSGILQELVYP